MPQRRRTSCYCDRERPPLNIFWSCGVSSHSFIQSVNATLTGILFFVFVVRWLILCCGRGKRHLKWQRSTFVNHIPSNLAHWLAETKEKKMKKRQHDKNRIIRIRTFPNSAHFSTYLRDVNLKYPITAQNVLFLRINCINYFIIITTLRVLSMSDNLQCETGRYILAPNNQWSSDCPFLLLVRMVGLLIVRFPSPPLLDL